MVQVNEKKVNVLIVDWSGIAQSGKNIIFDVFGRDYKYKSAYTKDLGFMISQLLGRFKTLELLRPNNIHIIGHSLGAQTAGAVGRDFLEEFENPIQQIVSLDAASPNFDESQKAQLLAKLVGPVTRNYPCLRLDFNHLKIQVFEIPAIKNGKYLTEANNFKVNIRE